MAWYVLGHSGQWTSIKCWGYMELKSQGGIVHLKMHGPIFQNLVFCFIWRIISQRCKFQISVETAKLFGCTKQFCTLQLHISYCVSLIMVTITRHIFINIFHIEHFSAVKFAMGYEKNMSILVIAKPPKARKKSWNDRTRLL